MKDEKERRERKKKKSIFSCLLGEKREDGKWGGVIISPIPQF